jgi:hypothetical protein
MTVFIQVDGLRKQEQLERVRLASFIIHETSPGNHQAWIAVSCVPAGMVSASLSLPQILRKKSSSESQGSAEFARAGTEALNDSSGRREERGAGKSSVSRESTNFSTP